MEYLLDKPKPNVEQDVPFIKIRLAQPNIIMKTDQGLYDQEKYLQLKERLAQSKQLVVIPANKAIEQITEKMRKIKLTDAEPKPERKRRIPEIKVPGIPVPLPQPVEVELSDIDMSMAPDTSFYMNNRMKFMNKITQQFQHHRDEFAKVSETASCEDRAGEFTLLTHQKLVRDYLNVYTPYRGLLLYHGLGSGKTCSSIAISEGMKTNKKIIVMTLASLEDSFYSELRKCGDILYRRDNSWEFVNASTPEVVAQLSKKLMIDTEYIQRKKGAWVVRDGPVNTSLTDAQMKQIDQQIELMIRSRYHHINYNGLHLDKYDAEYSKGGKVNPFDGKVVIVDEAHNLVSRISNKLKEPKSLAYRMYNDLMEAKDVKIVFLSGTPMINYPNELGIMFNMLRGKIKTWTIDVSTTMSEDKMLNLMKNVPYDYFDFNNGRITVTRNPTGFINTFAGTPAKVKTRKNKQIANKTRRRTGGADKRSTGGADKRSTEGADKHSTEGVVSTGGGYANNYTGVVFDNEGFIDDEEFIELVESVLVENNIEILNKPNKKGEKKFPYTEYLALPDKMDEFESMFIRYDKGQIIFHNENLFKNRILGLVSYFRSAQESLLPDYIRPEDESDYFLVKCEMSDYQLKMYEQIRAKEREIEKNEKKKNARIKGNDIYSSVKSSYRTYSRAFCNFVPPEDLSRPFPKSDEVNEEDDDKKDDKKDDNKMFGGDVEDDVENDDVYEIKTPVDTDEDAEDEVEDSVGEDSVGEDSVGGAPRKKVVLKATDFPTTPAIVELPTSPEPINEGIFDAIPAEERINSPNGEYEADDIKEESAKDAEQLDYNTKLQQYYSTIENNLSKYLSKEALEKYSPKFLNIIDNITAENREGLHLIYSAYRTIEGVGLLSLALKQNGFAQFKIQRNAGTGTWSIVESKEDESKPKFVIYSGTETNDEKEIILDIYNGNWQKLENKPATRELVEKLRSKSSNNNMGEIIKIIMITASGAEGINMRNTRFVHIVEPYWHPVRTLQVIGRARRICSHASLEDKFKTVQVFLYISVLSEEQRKSDKFREFRVKDKSMTSDEVLLDISETKRKIMGELLSYVKSASIDCEIYKRSGSKEERGLKCYSVKAITNDFVAHPSYKMEVGENRKQVKVEIQVVTYVANAELAKMFGIQIGDKIKFAKDTNTGELYDYDSYQLSQQGRGELILVAIAENTQNGVRIVLANNKDISSRIKVAIIVPFRDIHVEQKRAEHLNKFVPYMIDFLSKSAKATFKIYIVEQSDDGHKFNRGKLLNIGYKLAKNDGCNVFVFHDVDLLPSTDLLEAYTTMPAPKNPVHIAKLWKDRYSDNDKYFGGIVVFNGAQFEKINGFPNNFWGWGGEDDELQKRISDFGFVPVAPKSGKIEDLEEMNLPQKLDVLKQHCDWKCKLKWELLNLHETTWKTNGLTNLSYNVRGDTESEGGLTRRITVDIASDTGLKLDMALSKQERLRIITNPPVVCKTMSYRGKEFHVFDDSVCIGGTKQRLLGRALEKIGEKEIVYAGPETGFAQVALAFSTFLYGKTGTAFLNSHGSKKKNVLTEIAEVFHLKVFNSKGSKPWTLEESEKAAKTYVEKDSKNRFLLPFGLKDVEGSLLYTSFYDALKESIDEKYLKTPPKRLWVTAGSGFLLNILHAIWSDTTFIYVQVGKTVWDDQVSHIKNKIKYVAPENFAENTKDLPPYDSVPWYDAKVWQFFMKHGEDGDYIWNVGAVTKDSLENAKKLYMDLLESDVVG